MKVSKEFSESLVQKLQEYVQRKIYPMHMPGHKRNLPICIQERLEKIWELDLTEVEGSDCLHHAKGIIKEAQEFAACAYGAKKTFFLINGSSCGILSAIRACTDLQRPRIILAKESHMSAYNAVDLCGLTPILIPSYKVVEVGNTIDGEEPLTFNVGINIEHLCQVIKSHHKEVCAVFLTSPTYEGMVSDVGRIATIAHQYHLPLIVDEAHGAHLRFMEEFSGISSALDFGADIVIQSVHKTLPAFTQSAILHVSHTSLVESEKIRENLEIFESSSPSYILMSSIDLAIRYMAGGREEIHDLCKMQVEFYEQTKSLKHVKVAREYRLFDEKMKSYDSSPLVWDLLKVVIYSKRLKGRELANFLRRDYLIEPEMTTSDYVLCMLTIGDTKEGIDKLYFSLLDLDKRMEEGLQVEKENRLKVDVRGFCNREARHPIYAFPPDIPIVRKGEIITAVHIEKIEDALRNGLRIFGLEE